MSVVLSMITKDSHRLGEIFIKVLESTLQVPYDSIILVDDSSTGGTRKVVKEFVDKYDKELINPGATLHWWSHARPAETSRIVISKEAITRAKEVLGWYPKYDLQSGLKQAINEWREVLGA